MERKATTTTTALLSRVNIEVGNQLVHLIKYIVDTQRLRALSARCLDPSAWVCISLGSSDAIRSPDSLCRYVESCWCLKDQHCM